MAVIDQSLALRLRAQNLNQCPSGVLLDGCSFSASLAEATDYMPIEEGEELEYESEEEEEGEEEEQEYYEKSNQLMDSQSSLPVNSSEGNVERAVRRTNNKTKFSCVECNATLDRGSLRYHVNTM